LTSTQCARAAKLGVAETEALLAALLEEGALERLPGTTARRPERYRVPSAETLRLDLRATRDALTRATGTLERAVAALSRPMERLAAEIERVAELRRRLEDLAGRVAPDPLTRVPAVDLRRRVHRAVSELGTQAHRGGLVPLPALRRALPDVAPETLEATLLEMERAYEVDLQIAQDPGGLADADQGLRVPGRGLLYFVCGRREPR
jgi:hypothetical protein